MNNLALKELIRSKEEKRILTGNIIGIEEEYYKIRNESIPCAVLWYEDIKILIPVTHLTTKKQDKATIRGMLGAEIDFLVIEVDTVSNIAIASRIDAMDLRAELELPKLKVEDIIRVRIIAVGIKCVVTEMYGKEVVIKAENLQHTYIVNCKEIYKVGEYLKVKVKKIDLKNNNYELSCTDFIENPYKNIRKYVTENGEYKGRVVAFPKKTSGIIVQLEKTNITCLIRVPAKFNQYPHYMDMVLIRLTQIIEDKKLLYGYLVRVI